MTHRIKFIFTLLAAALAICAPLAGVGRAATPRIEPAHDFSRAQVIKQTALHWLRGDRRPDIWEHLKEISSNAFVSHAEGLHRVQVITDGPAALQTVLDLIGRAEKSIQIEAFLFNDSDAGYSILAALLERRAEVPALQVQILLDHHSEKGKPSLPHDKLLALEEAGFEIKFYNAAPNWNKALLTHRNHKKTLVVDRQIVVGGGRNFANGYFDIQASHQYMDMSFVVHGPIAERVAQTFDETFAHGLSSPFDGKVNPAAFMGRSDDAESILLARRAIQRLGSQSTFRARLRAAAAPALARLPTFEVAQAGFVADYPGQSRWNRMVYPFLNHLLRSAQSRVLMENPYFILENSMWTRSSPLKSTFEELLRRDVQLEILTNGFDSMIDEDSRMPYLAQPIKRDMLGKGMRIFEYTGRPTPGRERFHLSDDPTHGPSSAWSTHAKVAVIDDRWVWGGSHNFDPRSANINLESGFLFESPALAAHLTSLIERHKAATVELKRGTPEVEQSLPLAPEAREQVKKKLKAHRLLYWLFLGQF
jgi:putative cardiolipin synthase